MKQKKMPTTEEIKEAASRLEAGDVVGMPTETVYGLAARIDLPGGIERIFQVKERPFFDPLIVHVYDIHQVKDLVSEFSPLAKALAKRFWPGPLTLVLPKSIHLNPMITSGLETVGVRMPKHPVALELLKATQVPLAAPSANKFGKTSPTAASHVREEFKTEKVFVLDGGESDIGIESTVLSIKDVDGFSQLAVLRPGHILRSEIEEALKEEGFSFQFVEKLDRKESPGHMKHHYMPSVPLILVEDRNLTEKELREEVESRLSELPDQIEEIKIIKPKNGIQTWSVLKLSQDPVIAARSFYADLRQWSASSPDCLILYREESHQGERWQSLYDRIEKAASLIVKTKA